MNAAGFTQEHGSMRFEVASVKRSDPKQTGSPANSCRGGPGTRDPGLFVCENAALAMLVCQAYDLQFYELVSPEWMINGGSEAGYDVTARVPVGTTQDKFRVMLQNLLAERFLLVVHRDTRQMPRYSLKLGKGTPRIYRSAQPAPPGPRFAVNVVNGHLQYLQHNSPLSAFAGFLSTQLSSSVVDETGLNGDYDLRIEFMPDQRWRGFSQSQAAINAASDDPFPDVFTAIKNQLDLRLEHQKGPVTVLVVDHAERKPTPN